MTTRPRLLVVVLVEVAVSAGIARGLRAWEGALQEVVTAEAAEVAEMEAVETITTISASRSTTKALATTAMLMFTKTAPAADRASWRESDIMRTTCSADPPLAETTFSMNRHHLK
jgi:hypothetical protein